MRRDLNYVAMEIKPSRLSEAVARSCERPWIGWNVTLPHKTAILPLLDSVDPSAREIGAANVVRFLDRQSIGYNTDAEGFLAPLQGSEFFLGAGLSPREKRAVVLGAGGASKAVCAALRRMEMREIQVISRSGWNWDPACIRQAVEKADLVVQATPLGMDGKSSPVSKDQAWKRGAVAYDLVYKPLETPFLRQARAAGASTLGGLAMLGAQAAATWRIWFGETVPVEIVRGVEDYLRKSPQ